MGSARSSITDSPESHQLGVSKGFQQSASLGFGVLWGVRESEVFRVVVPHRFPTVTSN